MGIHLVPPNGGSCLTTEPQHPLRIIAGSPVLADSRGSEKPSEPHALLFMFSYGSAAVAALLRVSRTVPSLSDSKK